MDPAKVMAEAQAPVRFSQEEARAFEENALARLTLVVHDDFMTFEPQKDYDVIVMNPPFCKGQDARHILKALSLARKTVVAIGGSGILYRTDKVYTELRETVKRFGGTIEPLPEGSFKESGTAVNTCLIVVKK